MPITKSTNCRNITISNIITRSNVPATKSTNCRNIKCCHLYTYSCFIVTIIIKLQKLNENENVGPLLDQHFCSIFYLCIPIGFAFIRKPYLSFLASQYTCDGNIDSIHHTPEFQVGLDWKYAMLEGSSDHK